VRENKGFINDEANQEERDSLMCRGLAAFGGFQRLALMFLGINAADS